MVVKMISIKVGSQAQLLILRENAPLQVSLDIITVAFLLTAMILDKEEIQESEADMIEELKVVMIIVMTAMDMMMTTVW